LLLRLLLSVEHLLLLNPCGVLHPIVPLRLAL
jgi:hypothetical protein